MHGGLVGRDESGAISMLTAGHCFERAVAHVSTGDEVCAYGAVSGRSCGEVGLMVDDGEIWTGIRLRPGSPAKHYVIEAAGRELRDTYQRMLKD